jgi:hypothetical protein
MKKIITRLFQVILFFGLLIFSLHLTDWLFNPKGFNIFKYSLRALLLLVSLLFFWKMILGITKENNNKSLKNTLSFISIFYSTIILLEIFFSFLPLSCSGENVLVSQNWFNYYWVENHLGYRDKNSEETDRAGKKNILIIGDSYTAGHGLNDADKRFSNILQQQVSCCADVFNLGVCGADTDNEFQFLTTFPVKPDLIIVAHVNNDIYTVLEKKQILEILKLDTQYKSHKKRFKRSENYFLKHSFLLNFIDYLLIERNKEKHLAPLADKFPTIEQFLDSDEARGIEMCYYKNDSLMNLQLKRIDKFIAYSTSNNVPLLFILFPKMNDVVIDFTDRTANQPIARYLRQRGIPAINLTSILKPIEERKRMVGKFDSHPGLYTNSVVADTLKKYLAASQILEKP